MLLVALGKLPYKQLRILLRDRAPAILTLLNPRRYGVIDRRVWQLLYMIGAVTKNPSGVGSTFDRWHQFLMIIRQFAKEFRVSARDIERSLFSAHQAYQKGTLYRKHC